MARRSQTAKPGRPVRPRLAACPVALVNPPDAERPLLGYERETAGHVGARIAQQIILFGAGLAESQQTGADAQLDWG